MAHPPPHDPRGEAAARSLTAGQAVAALRAGVESLTAVAASQAWGGLPTAQVEEICGLALRLRALAEGAAAALLVEAISRGIVAGSSASGPAAWLAQAAEGAGAPVTATVAGAFARYAKAARVDRTETRALARAVHAGEISVHTAAAVATDLALITSKVPPPVAGVACEAMIGCAARGDTPAQLAVARQGVIASYGEETLAEEQAELRPRRGFSAWRMERDGTWAATWRTDNAGKAAAEAALNALAAPKGPRCCADGPGVDGDGRPAGAHSAAAHAFEFHQPDDLAGPRDLRTQTQRRHDALLELCTVVAADPRLAGPHARPGATAKTQVVVTMPLADLAADRGYGRDEHGSLLDVETIRRLACDADVIPVVLGTTSAPLDLGRSARLASPEQVTYLRLRDGGCTFPGCDRPPSWCQAHHLIHWLDGGATDVDNLALLCTAHHTIVHAQRWHGRLHPQTQRVAWARTLTEGSPARQAPPTLTPAPTPPWTPAPPAAPPPPLGRADTEPRPGGPASTADPCPPVASAPGSPPGPADPQTQVMPIAPRVQPEGRRRRGGRRERNVPMPRR